MFGLVLYSLLLQFDSVALAHRFLCSFGVDDEFDAACLCCGM